MKKQFTIGSSILWTLAWFGFMLFYTFLDVAVWSDFSTGLQSFFNIITIVFCICAFLFILFKQKLIHIDLIKKNSWLGILLSIGCSVLLFLLLDHCLDPFFEGLFPASEEHYQDMISSLSVSPAASLIQVCILAPIIEEILMRGVILQGLSINYNKVIALIISAILFAVLHFNMVQTISAFICGIVLGLLFLYSGSVACCIIAHMGYNLISYFVMVYPVI